MFWEKTQQQEEKVSLGSALPFVGELMFAAEGECDERVREEGRDRCSESCLVGRREGVG